jgi:hypothetical protein
VRISVTLLEQYRLFTTADWMPESDLIDSIKGQTVFTPKMMLGRSGHCALENREPTHIKGRWHECETYRWAPETILGIRPYYPSGGVSEIKGTREFRIGRETITLVGKGDHFIGTEGVEAKFTLSDYDPNKYIHSMQWRSYAAIFGLSGLTYVVFCCALDDDTNEVTIKGVNTLKLYPYANLEADVVEKLGHLVEYVKARRLEGYLQPREAA